MLETVVERALSRATPEQRERVRQLRRASDEAPSPERDQARADIALSLHGIYLAHWRCDCGAEYAYPNSACSGCKRPYPRKCLTAGCANVNEARAVELRAGGVITEAATYCPACSGDMGRRARAESYARSSIPPRERHAAQRIIAYPEQADALAKLEGWVNMGPDSRTWKRHKSEVEASLGGTCAVYLGGRPGRGKSVLAAFTVYRAFVDHALVTDFRWHSQASLAQLFSERWQRDTDKARERAEHAVSEWRAVTECSMLVIDDLFAQVPTQAFGEALATLIRERLDHMRPTVITSNVRPQWAVYFEHDVGRLQSRWNAYGLELVVSGVDLRRAA